MRLAVPPEVELSVFPVDEAARELAADPWGAERVMVVMPGLKEARRLVEAGWTPASINLGGVHDAPGRAGYTPSLFLGPEDKEILRFLVARKIPVDTRALPMDENVPVETYL